VADDVVALENRTPLHSLPARLFVQSPPWSRRSDGSGGGDDDGHDLVEEVLLLLLHFPKLTMTDTL